MRTTLSVARALQGVASLCQRLLAAVRRGGRLTRRIARFPCPACGRPFGERSAAAREDVGITGPPAWWLTCPSCGDRSMVTPWLLDHPEADRLRRVPATVFAYLTPGHLRLTLLPGVGLADGGIPHEVPLHDVPFSCRMPNTPLWVTMDRRGVVVGVERRG